MTERRYYMGSIGPFFYDDTDTYPTPADAADQGFGDGDTMDALITDGSITVASFKLFDVDKSNTLELKWYVQEAVNRTLNIVMTGGDRTLTINADSIVNQNLSTDAAVTHTSLTLTGSLNVGGASSFGAPVAMTSSLGVAGTSALTVTTVSGSLGVAGVTSLNQTLIFSSLGVAGAVTIATVANAGADVDKFLVLDAGYIVDYRTGAEVLSDIGAGVGDVTAAAALTDHLLVRGDIAAKAVQTSGITVDDSDNLSGVGTIGCGAITSSGNLSVVADTDGSAQIGRAHVGWMGDASLNDYAGFSHVDMDAVGSYALIQGSTGATLLNAAVGQVIYFRINNSSKVQLLSTGDFDIISHNAATVGLKLGGTLITASATEINQLDGNTFGSIDVTNATNHLVFAPATAILSISGVVATLSQSPRIHLLFNGDNDAVLGYLAYDHDDVALAFDAYHNGTTWISSDVGANFAVYKTASQLQLCYNAGTAKGSDFASFTVGIRLTLAGVVRIDGLAGTGSRNVVADANGVLSAP